MYIEYLFWLIQPMCWTKNCFDHVRQDSRFFGFICCSEMTKPKKTFMEETIWNSKLGIAILGMSITNWFWEEGSIKSNDDLYTRVVYDSYFGSFALIFTTFITSNNPLILLVLEINTLLQLELGYYTYPLWRNLYWKVLIDYQAL